MKNQFLKQLTLAFEKHINKIDAPIMKRYMRDKFEFYGIKRPLRKQLLKETIKEFGKPTDLEAFAKEAWTHTHREVHYATLDVLYDHTKQLVKTDIDLLEYLITHQSWWDTVDYLAPRLVGRHFQQYADLLEPRTKKWIEDDNFWLQRAAIIFQLKYKDKTDFDLMKTYIKKRASSKEFFVQKGIGWALREYSKHNPAAVKTFINNTDLMPLSKREGSKKL